MSKQTIYSSRVVPATSPHSHAVKTGGLVFVSGCPPLIPGNAFAQGDFATQMRHCMTNIIHVLDDAGSSLEQVVKVNVYLDRISDFPEMNEIYREYFGSDPASWPARTTVEARLPSKEFLLEIDCVAELLPER
jgi:2-iminobutanoate/2-iminopropanoate deaminase